VRLNYKIFKQLAKDAGLGVEELAATLPRATARRKEEGRAISKIRNWLSGREKPRPKAIEIQALADALGVELTKIADFPSTARWVRSSPTKARLIADLVRGKSVDEAYALLQFSPKRAAVFVRKVLNAAVADAEAADAQVDRLFISESKVDEGVIIKRFQPKDRGRAHPIQKKTSHITIAVQERA